MRTAIERGHPFVLQGRSITMFVSGFVRSSSTALTILIGLRCRSASVQTQQRAGSPLADKAQPVNSGANPYRVIRDWAQLQSEGRPWGGSNGVAIDRDGRSVWATDRARQGRPRAVSAPKRIRSTTSMSQGKEIRSFGGGMFVWPHGIHVDREGNVWVTDARAAEPGRAQKFPEKATRAAWSSSSVPKARS
jgi:DNA-binding beta-propeller fold protein YncE